MDVIIIVKIINKFNRFINVVIILILNPGTCKKNNRVSSRAHSLREHIKNINLSVFLREHVKKTYILSWTFAKANAFYIFFFKKRDVLK